MSSMSPYAVVAPPGGSYAAATQALRTTARWLLTAAAGVGGALVAGLQLTSIGSLGVSDWPRLVLAVGGLMTALVAVGYVIFRASRLLTDEWITLAQLALNEFDQLLRNPTTRREKQQSQMLRGLFAQLEVYKHELYAHVAQDVTDLYWRLQRANDAARGTSGGRRRRFRVQDPDSVALALREAAGTVVQFANHYMTREKFKVLRREIARGTAVVVVGVLIFAYAANPPKDSTQRTNSGFPESPLLRELAAQLADSVVAAIPRQQTATANTVYPFLLDRVATPFAEELSRTVAVELQSELRRVSGLQPRPSLGMRNPDRHKAACGRLTDLLTRELAARLRELPRRPAKGALDVTEVADETAGPVSRGICPGLAPLGDDVIPPLAEQQHILKSLQPLLDQISRGIRTRAVAP